MRANFGSAVALLLAGACGGGKGEDSGLSAGTQGSDGTAASSSSSSTSGATSEGSGGASTGPPTTGGTGFKFDLGVVDAPPNTCVPGDPDCRCNAVDVLFVVDNSGSMQVHAAPTIAAFDTFVEEMITVLPAGTSLHVGVTRATGFYDPGNAGGWNFGTCEGFADGTWNPPTVGNNGVNGHQGRLFEQDGLRYFEMMTDADPQPLKTWFMAALTGAINGGELFSNSETVIAGAAYPFHPANAAFNAGFMREQAVLVLFLLSDSPDLSPKEIPTSDFVAMVSAAKAACGDQCVLTAGAIADGCFGQPENTNTRLYDFMTGFGQAMPPWTKLKFDEPPNFEGVLGAALAEVISATCDTIPPIG